MSSGERIPDPVLLKFETHSRSFKPAERKLVDYLMANHREVIHQSITQLSRNAGVSEATIVKLCQKIGYRGFRQLKIMLAQVEKEKREEQIYGEIDPGDSKEIIIKKIFQTYNQSLNNTRELITNADIEKAIKMFVEAKRVLFFGFWASGIVAKDAELKFKRINRITEAVTESHLQQTLAALLGSDDLVIAISESGRTKDLINALKIARDTGAGIIAITSDPDSPVAKLADLVLLTFSSETSFRGGALASRMSQLAVIDILFIGVALEDYDLTAYALDKTRLVMRKTKT